jgi:hypothetical protein
MTVPKGPAPSRLNVLNRKLNGARHEGIAHAMPSEPASIADCVARAPCPRLLTLIPILTVFDPVGRFRLPPPPIFIRPLAGEGARATRARATTEGS